ncbi:hypothetical protein D8674_038426 [Pyrus ussuriensis x Pyrus communis]|uniref:Uncharacterized protein n=1 Tax=Pyrus ussuriensis x Pyrus communis TaxID=2448454 RepID=A0A5N5FC89_9ROSA|nr:hypothetical protein D8674_038426 [Pyrus ussuriensis x Pyrus communis]
MERVRHRENKDNVRGRTGGDNPLSFISVYYAGHVRDLVRAIQMSDFQILLRIPNLATPSTFEPFHPIDTQ